jgi:transcriptional regulator with XRE-family HTH domain
MQGPSNQLQAFMRSRGYSQSTLARAAGVSQSTVSRALQGKHERQGAALLKLFSYAGLIRAAEMQGGGSEERVLNAFQQAWDGTEAHAEAVVRVIDALGGLQARSAWPPKGSADAT